MGRGGGAGISFTPGQFLPAVHVPHLDILAGSHSDKKWNYDSRYIQNLSWRPKTRQDSEIITPPSSSHALEIGSQTLTIKLYVLGHFGILSCLEAEHHLDGKSHHYGIFNIKKKSAI